MLTQKMRRRLDILLADDGSPNALAAVHFIKQLPISRSAIPKSSITVLEVINPNLESYDGPVRQADLTQVEEILSPMGLAFHPLLASGSPAEMILELANELHPDLVVLGASGRRPSIELFLGSVAQEVADRTIWPVLIVRASFSKLRNILFVTDGSENSLRATRYLARFPLPKKVQVKVLFVIPHLSTSEQVGWSSPVRQEYFTEEAPPELAVNEIWQVGETEGKRVIDQAVSILAEERIQATGLLLQGDPAEEIIGYAHDNDSDLIVAGGRGPDTPEKWLLGNVTRRLLHNVRCSTMIVRGNPKLLLAP